MNTNTYIVLQNIMGSASIFSSGPVTHLSYASIDRFALLFPGLVDDTEDDHLPSCLPLLLLDYIFLNISSAFDKFKNKR